uniref:Uncharacterized protein n=1 Tax=Arundo donax TaxID=35708 RepID=A0A0A8ZH21_ARUDO
MSRLGAEAHRPRHRLESTHERTASHALRCDRIRMRVASGRTLRRSPPPPPLDVPCGAPSFGGISSNGLPARRRPPAWTPRNQRQQNGERLVAFRRNR